MIDALFSQPNYLAAKKMLDATVLRHEAIASNIANLETPNFKRVDLAPTFSVEFERACASGAAAQINALQPTLAVDDKAVAVSRDGNTVNLENELMQMNKNALEHSLETQLITRSLVQLRMAITGKTI